VTKKKRSTRNFSPPSNHHWTRPWRRSMIQKLLKL